MIQKVVEEKRAFHGKGKQAAHTSSDSISEATFRDYAFSRVEETLDEDKDKIGSFSNESMSKKGEETHPKPFSSRRKKICFKYMSSFSGPSKKHFAWPNKKKRPNRNKKVGK